jgi:hypothetical protein
MAKADIVPPDLRAEIEKFDAAANAIVMSIGSTLDASEPPPMVYHYTNDVGLRGIIESGKIWLTDIFNLNDPSELSHGFSQAISILNDRASTGHPATKLFAQTFQHFGTAGGLQASAHFFVCSFSSRGDELGQWRAYADDGRGYALGFDTRVLESAFARVSETGHFSGNTFPVSYDDEELAGFHRQFIDMVFPLLTLPSGRQFPKDAVVEYMTDLSVTLAKNVAQSVLFYKHSAYSNEQEYRFLQLHHADVPPPEVKFRSRPHSLVRYREFDWRSVASDALKQIVIGPSADPQKAAQFAGDCLRSFHSGRVEIIASKVPYRAT